MYSNNVYNTDWGKVTLLSIGNGVYQVHDAYDGTYRGTIKINENEVVTNETINEKLRQEYSYVME